MKKKEKAKKQTQAKHAKNIIPSLKKPSPKNKNPFLNKKRPAD